jgi:PII-like signaling protein
MTMNGSLLRFYVHESDKHRHRPVWQWLLEQANTLGVRGGSAFRATAGFGRHHQLHQQNFFELAGTQTVEIEFIVTEDEARQLLALLQQEELQLFYARIAASFGTTTLAPDPK